jgi:hypothetical protein
MRRAIRSGTALGRELDSIGLHRCERSAHVLAAAQATDANAEEAEEEFSFAAPEERFSLVKLITAAGSSAALQFLQIAEMICSVASLVVAG